MRGHRALNRELERTLLLCDCRQQAFTLFMVTPGQSFEVSFHTAPLRLHSNTRIPGYYLLLTAAEWYLCWYLAGEMRADICIWLGRCVVDSGYREVWGDTEWNVRQRTVAEEEMETNQCPAIVSLLWPVSHTQPRLLPVLANNPMAQKMPPNNQIT